LATSLAFTKCLRKINVLFNDVEVFSLEKRVAEPRKIEFSKSLYSLVSPNKIFTLASVFVNRIQLDVSVKEDGGELKTLTTLYMRTATGSFKVSLSRTMQQEMERTTKKKVWDRVNSEASIDHGESYYVE
jgi:hypothetical protein